MVIQSVNIPSFASQILMQHIEHIMPFSSNPFQRKTLLPGRRLMLFFQKPGADRAFYGFILKPTLSMTRQTSASANCFLKDGHDEITNMHDFPIKSLGKFQCNVVIMPLKFLEKLITNAFKSFLACIEFGKTF